MNPRHRIIALLLSAVFIYSAFIHNAVLLVMQFHLKELVASLQDNNDDLLVLNADDFKSIVWAEKHEIIFKGQFYDVNSIQMTNGNYTIHCHHDVTEMQLLKAIWNHVNKQIPRTGHNTFTTEKAAAICNLNLVAIPGIISIPHIYNFLIEDKSANPFLSNCFSPPEV